MSAYLIKYKDTQISVFEYLDNQLSILKNKGEESWEYQDSSFWDWFQEKIEYEGQAISFVVFSNSEFKICSSINIAAKHHITQEKIIDFVSEFNLHNMKIQTFPTIDLDIKVEARKQIIAPIVNKKNTNPNKKSLQKYFKHKTARYKGK